MCKNTEESKTSKMIVLAEDNLDHREKEFFKMLTSEQDKNFKKNLSCLSLKRKYSQEEVDAMPDWVKGELMKPVHV